MNRTIVLLFLSLIYSCSTSKISDYKSLDFEEEVKIYFAFCSSVRDFNSYIGNVPTTTFYEEYEKFGAFIIVKEEEFKNQLIDAMVFSVETKLVNKSMDNNPYNTKVVFTNKEGKQFELFLGTQLNKFVFDNRYYDFYPIKPKYLIYKKIKEKYITEDFISEGDKCEPEPNELVLATLDWQIKFNKEGIEYIKSISK